MRLKFCTPADRDVTGAPVGGALYFDSVIGSPNNPGTSAAAPKRHHTDLPGTLAAGAKYYFRNGRRYQPGYAPPVGQYGANRCKTLTVSGTELSPSELIGWGEGEAALLGADMPLAGWGAVTDDRGNTYLATNGEQVDLPAEVGQFHGHFIGDEMLTPSFWSAACPADLSTVCRHEFFSTLPGALTAYAVTASLVQDWTADPSAATGIAQSRDLALAALPISITYEVAQRLVSTDPTSTTIWFKDPAIAAHYGGGSGPIGAAVFFRGNPSNFVYHAIVTAYDQATSTLTAVTPRSTANAGRVRPHDSENVEWWVVGAPYDLRQPGQFASVFPVGGGAAKAWRVRGDWQRGASTVGRWPQLFGFLGDGYLRLENIHMGRLAGQTRLTINPTTSGSGYDSIDAYCATFNVSRLSGSNWKFRQIYTQSAESMATKAGAGQGIKSNLLENIGIEQAWTAGGWSDCFTGPGLIDGMTGTEIGRTLISFLDSPSSGVPISGVTGQTLSDVVWDLSGSFHGNGVTVYANARDVVVDGAAFLDVPRAVTIQSKDDDYTITYPRGLEFKNLLMLGVRDVSATPAPTSAAYTFRVDNAFGGGLIDRMLMADGEMEFTVGTVQHPNDNAVIRRSYVAEVDATCNFAATNGGSPVHWQDTTAWGARAAVTSYGATALRHTVKNETPWTAAITEQQWKDLTKTAADHTVYESVTLGAQRWGWTIPAYADTTPTPGIPNPGSPVALQLSRNSFYAKTQAGRVIAHVIGARPMSVLSLPGGEANNSLFILDRGRLVASQQMPSTDVSVSLDETPYRWDGSAWVADSANLRRTTFTLTARR